MRFLLIAALFLGCAPAPATLKRGTFTPPPPAPVRPGVGAPSVGQPGQARPELPRSPHKRVLPPTAGPGIWAGDEPKAAIEDVGPAKLLDVPLPLGDPTDPESMAMTRTCAEQMDYALLVAGIEATARDLVLAPRKCLAAKLYRHCATGVLENYQSKASKGEVLDREFLARVKAMKQKADAFEKESCPGGEHDGMLGSLPTEGAATWDKVIRKTKR